jgi:hypothetical protein
MANQLTVQEQEAIRTLAKQGWKIRRIAKELGVSRNTVRHYVRAMELATTPDDLVEAVLESGNRLMQTDPCFDPGTVKLIPFRPPEKLGEKACAPIMRRCCRRRFRPV